MGERRFRFERTIAAGLVLLVGGAALSGCRTSSASADRGITPPVATGPAMTATPFAPETLDVGKLRKKLEAVPSPIRHASDNVLRVLSGKCNDAGCSGYAGAAFQVEVRGSRYAVTAGHVEKAQGLTCHNQFLEGRARGQTFSDRVLGRTGTFKLTPGASDDVDYSVPDLGMLKPAPSAALSEVAALPLAPGDRSLEPGQMVYAVGFHPVQSELSYATIPPKAHPVLRRSKNIVGGIVLGSLPGSAGATDILEVMGDAVQGDSGGPLMTPDGTVSGVNSSISDPETAAQVEQETGFHLVDYPKGQLFEQLYVQDVNTVSASRLASSMQAHGAC